MDEFPSIIPAPVQFPQAPTVPTIAGVAPAQFRQTQCDANLANSLGSINKVSQAAGTGSGNGLLSNPALVGMSSGDGILNSALARSGAISARPGASATNSAGGGGNQLVNTVGGLLGKGVSAGVDALGGIKGIACKISCFLGFNTPPICTSFIDINPGDLSSNCIAGFAGGFGDTTGDISSFGFNCIGIGLEASCLAGFAGAAGDFGGTAGAAAADIAASEGADVASVASEAASIVCTLLMQQGRLKKKWFALSAKDFQRYSKPSIRGYFYLAAPSVAHLANTPNSIYSRILEKIMNCHAEHVAAKAGAKDAKSHPIMHGLLAVMLWPVFYTLGLTVARDQKIYTRGGSFVTSAS